HPELPRAQGRRRLPRRQGQGDDRRAPQHRGAGPPGPAVARVERRRRDHHGARPADARAHRRARARAAHRRALLPVIPQPPVTLRLDVRGPAEISAADIQTTSDVEILNKDLHIATVNAKGRLAIDITVERGRGYVSADRNKKSTTIGVIPVDSIFSPVRRVTFDVEPTRVEQSTNFDRLILDIETDGSITARDSLASAGDTLRSLVALVADMS